MQCCFVTYSASLSSYCFESNSKGLLAWRIEPMNSFQAYFLALKEMSFASINFLFASFASPPSN